MAEEQPKESSGNNAQDLVGKDFVAFVTHPNPWGRCYAYPQYLLTKTGAERIDAKQYFPDKGCIPISIIGRETSEYVRHELGKIAILRLNNPPMEQAESYRQKDGNRYFTKFRRSGDGEVSYADLKSLREDGPGRRLVQIVGLSEDYDFSRPSERPFRLHKDSRRILTDIVMVSSRSDFMKRLVGPFVAKRDGRGTITLSALEQLDWQVGVFGYYDWDTLITFNDRSKHTLTSFAVVEEVRRRLAESAVRYDWIPDSALADILASVADARRQEESASGSTAGDDGSWHPVVLPDDLKGLRISDARRERLLKIVADDAAWGQIVSRVDERLLESKGELEASISQLEGELGEKEAYRSQLASQLDDLRDQASRESEEYARTISAEAESIAQKFSDDGQLARGILESEVLRAAVARLGAGPGREVVAPPLSNAIRPSEAIMTTQEIVGEVCRSVRERAGRSSVSRNDVINLLVCLTQGPIVTLAGPTGAGKTSAARILAGALGLANATAPRLCEVPVERGWSSTRDFIASYDPAASQPEQPDPQVLEALVGLDGELGRQQEAGNDALDVAPFLFVFDEAAQSSPEYYLAPFLRACDNAPGSNMSLPVGGGHRLRVPGYTRLLATVTTGSGLGSRHLSPRFLDRTWVIRLQPDDIDLSAADPLGQGADFSSTQSFSAGKLEKSFGYHGESLSNELRAKLLEVFGCCRAHGEPISPRSQKMMRDYVAVASALMDGKEHGSEFVAVDYAVCQKVLPMLGSLGSPRNPQLLKALGEIGGLPLCRGMVQELLGEEVQAEQDSGPLTSA